MDAHAATEFCARWLPAWTGNDPDGLAAFYTDDVFYSDPAFPAGLQGKAALLGYFRKLLARYPDWVWTHRRSLPLPDGFVNFWHARFPSAGEGGIGVDGVCIVQLRDGLIHRNEVFFDRTPLAAGGGR